MEIVGKFEINNTKYLILCLDGKYKVGKVVRGFITFDLSKDENALVKEVTNKLIPQDNLIEVTPVTINGNTYIPSYSSNNIYVFNPTPNEIDLAKLNKIFNDQHEYETLNNKNDNTNFIKRVLHIGKKTIVVFLAASMLFGNLTALASEDVKKQSLPSSISHDNSLIHISDQEEISVSVLEDTYNLLEQKAYQSDGNYREESKEYSVDDLINAYKNNPNLSEEEKAMILSKPAIFYNNFEYMDKEYAVNTAATLKVEYNCGFDDAEGKYYFTDNTMRFPRESTDAYSFTHEFCHSLTNRIPKEHETVIYAWDHYETVDNNDYSYLSFLIEGTNVIFNNEYYMENAGEYDMSYRDHVIILKALAEIIGSESLIKYHNEINLPEIYNELYNVVPDLKFNNQFIKDIRTFGRLYLSGNNEPEDIEIRNAYYNEIIQMLKTYYETKYLRSYETDLLMCYYLEPESFVEKLRECGLLDDGDCRYLDVSQKKIYFNGSVSNEDDLLVTAYFPSERTWVKANVEALKEELMDEYGKLEYDEEGRLIVPSSNYYWDGDVLMEAIIPPDIETEVHINSTNRYISPTLDENNSINR